MIDFSPARRYSGESMTCASGYNLLNAEALHRCKALRAMRAANWPLC
ncbi:MAG: hypothetical protein LLG01_10820 [Planctomycetaceae bacterium]|nr:hypothetical protein [Planctomycetaceae bacterium]